MSNGYDFNPFEGARFADPNLVGMKNSNAQRMKDIGTMEYDPFTVRATSSPTPIWRASCRS